MISLKFLPYFRASERRRRAFAPGWPLAMVLLLAACAPAPVRRAQAEYEAEQHAREQLLARSGEWSFRGRVVVSAEGQAGSGRIEWRQSGDDFDVRLSAPVTGQSWRLHGQGGRVRLEGLADGMREGEDAEAVLLEATGWRIPVAALSAWVRGVRTGGPADMDFDPRGRLSLLSQLGWAVEYREWGSGDPPLPRKVFVRRQGASVRLAIDSWGQP